MTTGVDGADAGALSGLMNTAKQFGGALGLALLIPLTGGLVRFGCAFGVMAAMMVVLGAVSLAVHRRGHGGEMDGEYACTR